jgi:NADPH-dependent glutamate synthase beta subunit-like oxidoreductase/Pyruvate/2-oxoacid:ferredoxin oxidoreductase delta subunit
MEACNRRLYDESINIREVERYAADHGQRPPVTKPHRAERIAVVGSGPAGLSAAYHLARLGYPITLIEGGDELGGLLRTGIPAYRLPRDVLGEEIDYILRHGVEVKLNQFVRRPELLKLSHEFAAVFVATGLQGLRAVDLGSEAEDRVVQGIEFLDEVRKGQTRIDGERVVVVGGGNTAIDAARSARRIGAQNVRIIYRRTRAEMPAISEEVEEALEEGIVLDELVAPLRLRHDGIGSVLTCQRMRLGEPDESGRPRPVPDTSEDAVFDVRCDRAILALGQSSDLAILPEGSEITENGSLLGLSGAPIFAGGDFATNEGTVTAAIGSGRKAALHIHRTLTDEDLFPPPAEPIAEPDVVTAHFFTHAPREEGVVVPPRERRFTFTEVRQGYIDEPSHHPAVEEAHRCFSCGVCNECDRCLEYCPEGIVLRVREGYDFDYSYCKGCGICSSQCPRGVIYMAEL